MNKERNSKLFTCQRTITKRKYEYIRGNYKWLKRWPTQAVMPVYKLDQPVREGNANARQGIWSAGSPQNNEENKGECYVNDGNNDAAIESTTGNNSCEEHKKLRWNDVDVINKNAATESNTVHNSYDESNVEDVSGKLEPDDGDIKDCKDTIKPTISKNDPDESEQHGRDISECDNKNDDDYDDVANRGRIHIDDDDDDDDGNDGDGGDDDDDDDDADGDDDTGYGGDDRAFSVAHGPIITMRPNVREHEILIAVMATAQRFKLSLEATLGIIQLFKGFTNHNTLPSTKDSLWKKLGRDENSSQTRYLYCKRCKDDVGIGKIPARQCECGDSGPEKPLSMVSHFIVLNITMQLKRIFSIPNIGQLLDYRYNRQIIDRDGMEYMFDGKGYKKLQKRGQFLNSNLNFSLTINTDGCQVAKSSKESAWPVLLSINELPPHARKRFIILAGIWVDKQHPDFNLYMPPIVAELNRLYLTGIEWKPDGVKTVTSKFIITICSVDTPARAKILNVTSFNGQYGCNLCYAPGIRMENGSRKYPIELIVNRTDAEIRRDMTEATRTGTRIRGIIGNSMMRYIPQFDLGRGVVVDSMHCVDIGVVKKLTEMIIFGKVTDHWFCANAGIRRIIDDRLRKIRTPSGIARKPRPIGLSDLWKASEWRNWLLYYCVPCLKDLIPDEYLHLFAMLSEAIHILNSDTISTEQLQTARALIDNFQTQYEIKFQIDNMTTNMHLLRHLSDTVENWGPLWGHNAYIFESFNNQILNSLNSSTGRQLQIMNRYLLNDFINGVQSDRTLGIMIKLMVRKILNTSKKVPIRNDVDYERYHDFQGLGKNELRNPRDWEINVLREERQTCNSGLTVYKKCIVKGTIYSSKERDDGNTRSCDKYVYTNNGKFAEILSIVSFEGNVGDRIYGMFVKWFVDTGNMPVGKHIRCLTVSTRGFIKVQDVRLPAILLKWNNVLNGVRMANTWETD